jgi:hypothetical protein
LCLIFLSRLKNLEQIVFSLHSLALLVLKVLRAKNSLNIFSPEKLLWPHRFIFLENGVKRTWLVDLVDVFLRDDESLVENGHERD